MSLKDVILGFEPTSYWPLHDEVGASCRDEMGLHDAMKSGEGVKLSVVPFGESRAAFFDGERGSCLTMALSHRRTMHANDLVDDDAHAAAAAAARHVCMADALKARWVRAEMR